MSAVTPDQIERFNSLVLTQVINMDRSTDRLAVIGGYLDAAGVRFQRQVGVDGKKLDLEGDPELKRKVDLKRWMQLHHRNPSAADVGCYLSHFNAIKTFSEQSEKPLGLIFEDDAAVAPDFIAAVLPAIQDVQSWDILKLHARHPGPLVVRRVYNDEVSLCSYIARHAGGTAYVITHEAAKKRSWLDRQTDRPILPRWALPFRRAADEVHRFTFNMFNDGGLQAMLFGPDKRRPG